MKKANAILTGVAIALVMNIMPSAFSAGSPTPTATKSNPYGGGTVDPAGPNEPILTITNGSKTRKFTMKNLLAMNPAVISIFEPFVKKRQKFTVIPLAKLFEKLGINLNSTVTTKALNDYVYKNKASAFVAASGYLAIKRNGTDIPYDEGGPIRLVYPDTSSWSKSLDPWNWSLSSITTNR